jgi:hypothetical protein
LSFPGSKILQIALTRTLGIAGCLAIFWNTSFGQEAVNPEEQQRFEQQRLEDDARRQVAVAEFTRKMKEANYPALFDQAAQEFSVPGDVLKAVAFAETRWEHLTWPPGETQSPDTGMPRPYGIMSLWDNKYFGHSLIEAAKLIGRDPEELKRDPLQNMRGAAALLRKIYNATPRPDGSSELEIESWRYAIRVYCGIPEPDLNARHALDVYTFMSQGYHHYGVEWDAHPVNLEMIRQETGRLVAEAAARKARQAPAETNARPALATGETAGEIRKLAAALEQSAGRPAPVVIAAESEPNRRPSYWWIVVLALAAMAVLFGFYARKSHKLSDDV